MVAGSDQGNPLRKDSLHKVLPKLKEDHDDKTQKQRDSNPVTRVLGMGLIRTMMLVFVLGALLVLLFQWAMHPDNNERRAIELDAGRSPGAAYQNSLAMAKMTPSEREAVLVQDELSLKYTVRINTFRRNDLLKRVVSHYATCPRIDSIQIVWSDLENAPPKVGTSKEVTAFFGAPLPPGVVVTRSDQPNAAQVHSRHHPPTPPLLRSQQFRRGGNDADEASTDDDASTNQPLSHLADHHSHAVAATTTATGTRAWKKGGQRVHRSSFLYTGESPRVEFEVHSVDSLNNRFRPLLPIRTEAVFSVDDDLHIPCELLDFTFGVWRQSPRAMVGYMPRMHGFDEVTRKYTYHDWWYVWRHGVYSTVLTKACFLHRDFLYQYAGTDEGSESDENHPSRPDASSLDTASSSSQAAPSERASSSFWNLGSSLGGNSLRSSMSSSRSGGGGGTNNGAGAGATARALGKEEGPWRQGSSEEEEEEEVLRSLSSGQTPIAPEGSRMRAVHDYVDEHRNCEDLAMSFLVASSSSSPRRLGEPQQPAVWVRGQGIREIGSSGLSSDQAKHYSARSSCLDAFVHMWGDVMPLAVATSKVDRASSFWWWR